MSPDVCITEYTDPGCPFAWSAEPYLWRIRWLYGDDVGWNVVMVGLSESPEEYEEKGFTPESMAESFASLSREHGMPMATLVRDRMAATLPACRAVVAVRERAGTPPARALLRRLRVRHFSGEHLDEEATIAGAAADVGLDPAEVLRWAAEPEIEEALRADMEAARRPMPAARALDHKLANWSGGLRYTCPSLEITRASDGVRIAVPGFQPFAAYDVVLANLVPGTERRPLPSGPEEVLAWAGVPLASQEVAVLLDVTREEAREALGKVAVPEPVGFETFWSLRRYRRDSMAPSNAVASSTATSASPSSASG